MTPRTQRRVGYAMSITPFVAVGVAFIAFAPWQVTAILVGVVTFFALVFFGQVLVSDAEGRLREQRRNGSGPL